MTLTAPLPAHSTRSVRNTDTVLPDDRCGEQSSLLLAYAVSESAVQIQQSGLAKIMKLLRRQSDADRVLLLKSVYRRGAMTAMRLLVFNEQAMIDHRLNDVRSIECAVMADCQNQQSVNKQPGLIPLQKKQVSPLALLPLPSSDAVCVRLVIPLRVDRYSYFVVIERDSGLCFSFAEQLRLQSQLQLCLAIQLLKDPCRLGISWLFKRSWERLMRSFVHTHSRAVIVGGGLVLLFASLTVPFDQRVSATLRVEPVHRHILAAPQRGFIQSVWVEAGDRVTEGQLLARFEDSDLRLQQEQLRSDALQNQQQYAQALARHDRVEVSRLKQAEIRINTELSRLQMQARRMSLRAPADGVVLVESRPDALGAVVSAGEPLFIVGAIAQGDEPYRVVLSVPEQRVQNVAPGQHVAVRMAAEPSVIHQGYIETILPLVSAAQGINTVSVYASLDSSAALRPGMQGVGKIRVGRQPLMHQWFERTVQRLIWFGWWLGVLA